MQFTRIRRSPRRWARRRRTWKDWRSISSARRRAPPRADHVQASIVGLHRSHAGRQPLTSLERATVVEGCGLEGDRHSKKGNRRALLVMDQAVLEGFGLAPGAVREQITVRGVDLPGL